MRHLVAPLVFMLLVVQTMCRVYAPNAKHISPRETNMCESRQTPGPICESCELLSTCVKHSQGWVNIPIEACDIANGFYCNSREGMCSKQPGPCHPFSFESNFPCTSHGVFPDPYDCQKYHMCYSAGNALVSIKVDCGTDKAFDATTGVCSISIQHPSCREPQFKCNKVGDAHAWPNNANIFYICKASSNQNETMLYPTLYRCAEMEYFDEYYCRGAPTVAPTYNPRPPNSTDGDDDPNSTPAPTAPCKVAGLSADPVDCRMYYYCSGLHGTLKHNKCPAGTYFNASFLSCTLGNCTN